MNLKDKRKCILAVFLLAVLLVTSGYILPIACILNCYRAERYHHPRGIAAELAKELKLDTAGSEKDTPSFPTSTDIGRRSTSRPSLTPASLTLPITRTASSPTSPSPAPRSLK